MRALPHRADVSQMSIHPKGGHLLTIATNRELTIWDLDREEPMPWTGSRQEVTCAAWLAEGTRIALGTGAGSVEIREFPNGELRRQLDHPGGLRTLAISPNGRWLALGGATVRVWDLQSESYVTPPLEYEALTLTFTPASDRLVAGCADNTVRMFALPGGAKFDQEAPHRVTKPGFFAAPLPPLFIKGGSEFVTVLNDKEVGCWNTETGKRLWTISYKTGGREPLILAMAADPEQSRLAVGGYSGARIWDIDKKAEPKELAAVLPHLNFVTAMTVSPNGQILLTASEDNTCRLWSLADGEPIGPSVRHQAGLRLAAFTPDGGRFITSQGDGLVRVWAVPQDHPRDHAMKIPGLPSSARMSLSGRSVLATGAGYQDPPMGLRETRVFEVASGEPAGKPLVVGGLLVNAALAPETPQALTLCALLKTADERSQVNVAPAGTAGRAQFWNWQTGEAQFAPLPMLTGAADS